MMNIASPYFATDSIQSHRKGDFKSERYEVPSSQRSSYYGMLPEGVIDVDAPRFATPAYDPTYAMSIYRMKKKQETAFIQADVVCRMVNGMQTEITRNMRITLIDWLVRVAIDYRLESSTYALAIQYLDSALNLISVKKQDFQLLGCACLWLAAKLEELQPPQVDNLTYAAENCFDAEHLVLYEQKLLRIFEFKAAMPTRHYFAMRFVHVAQCTQRESALTQYLVELSLYDVGFLRHPMSLIAASALFMSLVILRSRREEIWTKTIAHFTEYEEVSLVPVVHALTILHNSFLDFFPSPSESQVFCKYELASWQNVSAITALIPGDVSARFSTAMASAMWMEIIQKKRGVI